MPLIGAADHREHLRLQLGLSAEIARDPLGADVEQRAHRRLLRVGRPIRIGAGQQAGQQLADRDAFAACGAARSRSRASRTV